MKYTVEKFYKELGALSPEQRDCNVIVHDTMNNYDTTLSNEDGKELTYHDLYSRLQSAEWMLCYINKSPIIIDPKTNAVRNITGLMHDPLSIMIK
jgi:hypothetical protein